MNSSNGTSTRPGGTLASNERRCGVDACASRHYARDLCKKHYTQILRHGKLTPERERGIVRVCRVKGCGRTDTINWYCRKHARQIRVHGRLTPEREHLMGFEGCRAPGCDAAHRARGYCAKHYNQQRWRRLKADRSRGKRRAPERAQASRGSTSAKQRRPKKKVRRGV